MKTCFTCAFADGHINSQGYYWHCHKKDQCIGVDLDRSLWVPNAFALDLAEEYQFIKSKEMEI